MDPTNPSRMTFNNAINIMLSAMGEAPYSDVDSAPVTGDVETAKNVLGETSKTVQAEGWNFNTEKDFPWIPSGNTITIPSNVLRWFFPPNKDSENKYVQRGTRLYNRKDHTFTITDTLEPTVILEMAWDDLPETAKHYIAIRAARVLQGRFLSSQTVHQFSEIDELRAKANMMEDEAVNSQANFLNNQDVGPIVFRRTTSWWY